MGPLIVGRPTTSPRSYEAVLVQLSIVTLAVAGLIFAMPPYEARVTREQSAGAG
jgi:hypothetical protein